MYLDFFELKEAPFNVTPDPRFLFLASSHREAYDHLLYGIRERKGFMTLVGEVGSGKTTLCRAVLAALPKEVRTALVLNPAMTATQLLRAILVDLGLAPQGRDRQSLIAQLNGYLLEEYRRGNNVAVFLDEAQALLPEVLEQVRLLSNLETDDAKLLQIVLAGQPELSERLGRSDLRQLRQRIAVFGRLRPLSYEDTARYIEHRLRVAGAADPSLFAPRAIRVVYRFSQGVPRLINLICDRALLAAYAAGRKGVEARDVDRAREELENGP